MKFNKNFEVTTQFTTKAFENSDDIIIEGIANYSKSKDRDGDRILPSAWGGNALKHYTKNPIILAYHDPHNPIGTAIEYSVDESGLHIVGKISKSAGKVYNLIKEGILRSLSIGFKALDIDYEEDDDVYIIKDLELFEISVVSVGASPESIFNVRKALSDSEYKELKKHFSKDPILGEGNKSAKTDKGDIPLNGEKNMTDNTNDKLQKQVAELTAGLSVLLDAQAKQEEKARQAEKAAKEQAEKEAAAAAKKEAEEQQRKALEEKENDKLATKEAITIVGTGAEALVKDLEEKFKAQEQTMGNTIKEFKEEIEAKNAELLAMQRSKMNFEDNATQAKVEQKDADTAVLLGKMLGVPASATKFGSNLLGKAAIGARTGTGGADNNPLGADGVSTPAMPIGNHMSSMDQDWEHSFSTRIWNDIQSRLVMEPLFGNIQMNTASLTLPINPEAKYGEWISRAAFENPAARLGAVDNGSTGAAQKHVLTDITLIAQKLAAKEYIGYEEEEDTILPIVSVIRDAIVHRMARSTDQALILGMEGTIGPNQGAWPFKGLVKLARDATAIYTGTGTAAGAAPATGAVPAGAAGKSSNAIGDLISTRRKLGNWGLNPMDVVYVVSSEFYYDLLEDPDFQTMDKVGSNATFMTGQVGMVSGSPVLVSGEFPAAGAGKPQALAINRANFYIGTLRGLLTERDRDIVAQQNVIVATRRFDFKQIITGQGVAALLSK